MFAALVGKTGVGITVIVTAISLKINYKFK